MMIVIKNKGRKLWSAPIFYKSSTNTWPCLRKKTVGILQWLLFLTKNSCVLLFCLPLSFNSYSQQNAILNERWDSIDFRDNGDPTRSLSHCVTYLVNPGIASACFAVVGQGVYYYPASFDPCPNSIWNQSSQSCTAPENCGIGLHEVNDKCIISPQPINNGGTCPNYTARPINISTGSKFFTQNDFVGSGNKPLIFSHYYNSTTTDAIWTSSYRQSLNITTDTIDVRRENGQVIPFELDNGVISPPSHRRENLVLNNNQYQLTLANNTVEAYDTNGRLLFIRYTNGVSHQLTYSGTTIVVNRANESLTLQLSDTTVDAVVTAIILPDNTTIQYSYDDTYKRLLSVEYFDNSAQTYFYEDPRFPTYITGIEDENGNRISSVIYDDQGRAISSEAGPLNSGIERTQIKYNEDGTRTLTNALGKQSTYHFTQFNGEYKMTQVEGHPSANCAGANQAYTYDANGFMASKTDWQGNITTYVHNDRGQETSRTEASGTAQARTITTEWHAEFNLPIKIIEPKRVVVMIYDITGRLLSSQIQVGGD